MKRFLQKSYSWLATLLLTVAFAVSGNVAAQGIELPFAFTLSSGGTVDGVGFYMWSADWVSSAELYGEGDANATWGTINLTSPAKNIVKVELTCRTNSWSGVGSAAAAAATVCETEDLGGSFTTNGAVAIWQGSAHKLTFSSTDDIDVYKMVVYLEEGEVVKECTVGVDHYADTCKPGKHETPFYRYTTLYMQENAATTTWTGSDNCPEGVTLTNEAGQQFRVAQFNTWKESDQLGVVLEENITTPGVYTLHIPEGLVAFESGKFNKEINVVWTIVEPDTRPTKDVVFDFTDGNYTNDGTLSYTKDGVVFTLNENRYNATAQGFRIATDGWVSFTAPEKATIKSIQLLQESSYGVSPDFSANAGEVSVYDKTLYWSGDDASVTLTDNYGSCYFTKAIVTLAVEESVEPTTKWEGEIVVNKTSISSVADLEGLQITFVDAQQVEFNEYGMYIVGNEDGSEVYAVWAQYPEEGYNGTYTLEGNTVTLNNFSTAECDPIPAGTTVVYLSDFSAFLCNGEDVDGDVTYFEDYAIAYEGAPAPVPFELVFRNNNVVCENGKKVEANEAGVGADFYLENEGLTAVGKTATLYKDGNAMSFVMTLVDATAISFLGGSSLITEPGTYLLEVPEGTYVDAAGNPSIAFYGQWVVIQKDEPVVDPTKKDKYTIKLSGTDYYFTTTEVKDNNVTTYSISATPEYFYIEPTNGGYTIQSADNEKFAGYDVLNSWDFSNNATVWTIGSLEGEPTLIRKNGSKGFGVDDRFEGAGVYTDKSGQYWIIEKFEEGGEVVDPVEPADLEQFAGTWYFKGEGAYLDYYEENVTPKDEYVVNVEAKDGKLYMTDLVGFVYDDPNAFIGTYDAQAETLTFTTPYTTCYVVDMATYEYYTNFKPLVFNVVKDEEGNVSLVNTTGWDFMYEDWFYTTYACGYTSCVMTREQQIVEPEPEGWNGNVLLAESAANLDDLLTFTVEFEDAKTVEAAGQDILGAVFDVNGNPYAIVLANGTFDVFGSVSFEGSKATVEFVKIADLNAELQASAAASVKRIGGFTQIPGEATVVFCSKSFVVDGTLVYDSISKSYSVGGEGVPTGIESINANTTDSIYDLSGRRVNNIGSGLYIRNGVKVYMK